MKPQIRVITDKPLLRSYFNHDPALCGYALGDMEATMWQMTTYRGCFLDENLVAVAVEWHGANPPVLLLFGPEAFVASLLSAGDLPRTVFYMLPAEHLAVLQRYYEAPEYDLLWRMAVSPETFRPPTKTISGLRPLNGSDAASWDQLFRRDPGGQVTMTTPTASRLASGVYFGIEEAGELVAVAGTHVSAPSEGIAAVGSVYTRPDKRGQGYATLTTAAVTARFFEMGVKTVILNVLQENKPAIHTYKKLGYHIHAPIIEGPAKWRINTGTV